MERALFPPDDKVDLLFVNCLSLFSDILPSKTDHLLSAEPKPNNQTKNKKQNKKQKRITIKKSNCVNRMSPLEQKERKNEEKHQKKTTFGKFLPVFFFRFFFLFAFVFLSLLSFGSNETNQKISQIFTRWT